MIQDDEIDALRALAKAATPGVWTTYKDGSESLNNRCNVVESGSAMIAYGQLSDEDAAFIAAANPQTILDLIDRLRKAEAVPEGYKPVPIEPTEEMLACADRVCHDCDGVNAEVYRTMIAAAPDSAEGEGEKE